MARDERGPGLELVSGDGQPAGVDAPWSEEAEEAVLAAPLMDPDTTSVVTQQAAEELFYKGANRDVFQAIRRLHERGDAVDPVTLANELKSAGKLEAVGGPAYLARLVDSVPTAANVEYHLQILREKTALRDLQVLASELLSQAAEMEAGGAGELLQEVTERIREVRERADTSEDDAGLRTVREIVEDPDYRSRPVVVADKLAYAERITMLSGREKFGKSSVARWATCRRSQGERVWGGVPVGGPVNVVYYGQEHDDDFAADIVRMGGDQDRIYYRDMRRIPGDRFPVLARDLEQASPSLLVVDTLSTIAAPLEPESGASTDWEPVMERLGSLAAESGAGILLLHHARKRDGSYRDSTAIGAGVDCILEMRKSTDGESNRRDVTAYPRAAIPVRDFSYVLTGPEENPRLELVDDSLPLGERVRRYVERNEPCSQRDVLDGVRGGRDEIRTELNRLCGDRGPLRCDDSATPFQYRTAQDPHRNAKGTEKNGRRNVSTDTGGGSVPSDPLSPNRERGSGTPAESVGNLDGDG